MATPDRQPWLGAVCWARQPQNADPKATMLHVERVLSWPVPEMWSLAPRPFAMASGADAEGWGPKRRNTTREASNVGGIGVDRMYKPGTRRRAQWANGEGDIGWWRGVSGTDGSGEWMGSMRQAEAVVEGAARRREERRYTWGPGRP